MHSDFLRDYKELRILSLLLITSHWESREQVTKNPARVLLKDVDLRLIFQLSCIWFRVAVVLCSLVWRRGEIAWKRRVFESGAKLRKSPQWSSSSLPPLTQALELTNKLSLLPPSSLPSPSVRSVACLCHDGWWQLQSDLTMFEKEESFRSEALSSQRLAQLFEIRLTRQSGTASGA
jgi:hypothetical protein